MNTDLRFTIKQLARQAGVSVRTLHYYDEIGLLRPARNPENNYRIYGRPAVLRLQQILFLRELGLGLEQIQEMLDRPEFDLLTALERHRKALLARQERLRKLVQTVERTIQHLKGNIEMDTQDLFAGFSEEQQKEYEAEAERRWGSEQVKQSRQRWGSYSPEKKRQVMQEGQAIYLDLAAAIPLGPDSPQAQDGIARWHQHIRYFYEPTKEILLGLADGYNDDPAFAQVFERIHPDLAAFMRQAIQRYCEKM